MSDLPKMTQFPLLEIDHEYVQRELAKRTQWSVEVETVDGKPVDEGAFDAWSFMSNSPWKAASHWASELEEKFDDDLIGIRVTGGGQTHRFEIVTEIRRERIVCLADVEKP